MNTRASTENAVLPARRLRLAIHGAVQGVGFRPFVYTLAMKMGVYGWVLNGPEGVLVEAEADEERLKLFSSCILKEKPPASWVAAIETTWLEPTGYSHFEIRDSIGQAPKSAWILPDLATCPQCLAEINDPSQRRHLYPFTNCTQCGPRFTIVQGLPYDRPNTTMSGFKMCMDCKAEYSDPEDRRFHAQPISCPACGPKVWLEAQGRCGPEEASAIEEAVSRLKRGEIVAMKGIGGFLLLCDARNGMAVRRLRERKKREEKPFAVMFPSLNSIRAVCEVSKLEEEWLLSSQAPIVLLQRLKKASRSSTLSVVEDAAPGNPWLGAMLPYAPLHYLLLSHLGFPVIATSGNLSEEPISIDNDEARKRLASIADAFLMSDRPIARHADDSIVRLSRGRQSVLRRARGLAPLPIPCTKNLKPVLALGAHLKSTVSIGWDKQIVTSQHLGDLETTACVQAFEAAIRDLCSLYDFKPKLVAADMHPDYVSTRRAETLGLPVVRIQHHHAHIAACLAEQSIDSPVLGVAFDGIGYGPDNTLWGGEFLRVDESGYKRIAHLRTFPLPGGEAAIREPRRSALGILAEGNFDTARLRNYFPTEPWDVIKALPASGKLSPRTSSVGRLFDAVAALANIKQINQFEGQAAMSLEYSIENPACNEAYPLLLKGEGPILLDWEPLISAVIDDVNHHAPVNLVASRFHNSLAQAILQVAKRAGLGRIVLCGGVFQNAYLTEKSAALLEQHGFQVHTTQRLPANDGAISAGQAYLAGLGWGTGAQPCV